MIKYIKEISPTLLIRGLILFFHLIISIIISNIYGNDILGEYIYLQAILYFSSNFCSLGAEFYIFENSFNKLYSQSILFSIVLLIVLFLSDLLLSFDSLNYIIIFLIPFQTYLRIHSIYFLKKKNQFNFLLFEKLLPLLISIIITCIFIFLEHKLNVSLVILISLFLTLFVMYPFKIKSSFEFLNLNLTYKSFERYSATFPQKLFVLSESLIINFIFGLDALGQYSIISKFPKLITLLNESFIIRYTSMFHKLIAEKKFTDLNRLLLKNLKFNLIIVILYISIIIMIWDFLYIIWPTVDFESLRYILYILFIAYAIDIFAGPLARILLFMNKNFLVFSSNLLGVILFFILINLLNIEKGLIIYSISVLNYFLLINIKNFLHYKNLS